MKIKGIRLWSCVALFVVATPLVAYHFWEYYSERTTQEKVVERPKDVPFEEILHVHEGTINEHVGFRKQQSLDKTGGAVSPADIEELLSFLTLFLQFGVLFPYTEDHSEENVHEQHERMVQEIQAKHPDAVRMSEILPVHENRIKERIDLLRQQSLEESFVELLSGQQYFYPGYSDGTGSWGGRGTNMETLLSTRTFLKVLQEFDALSPEQAIEKLYVFSERAMEEFETHPRRAKPMLCTAMLLAARMGEHKLLIDQIDEMQRIADINLDRMKKSGGNVAIFAMVAPHTMSLDDSCILTVLMHALNQADKNADNPFEEPFVQKVIPLYRWDAPLTHYDFTARRVRPPDPQDLVEPLVVYYFPSGYISDSADTQNPATLKKKAIIDILKERLSE